MYRVKSDLRRIFPYSCQVLLENYQRNNFEGPLLLFHVKFSDLFDLLFLRSFETTSFRERVRANMFEIVCVHVLMTRDEHFFRTDGALLLSFYLK